MTSRKGESQSNPSRRRPRNRLRWRNGQSDRSCPQGPNAGRTPASWCTLAGSTAALLTRPGVTRRGLLVARPGGLLLCGQQPEPEGSGCVLAADHAVSHEVLRGGAPIGVSASCSTEGPAREGEPVRSQRRHYRTGLSAEQLTRSDPSTSAITGGRT